jgi:hypothetical protein
LPLKTAQPSGWRWALDTNQQVGKMLHSESSILKAAFHPVKLAVASVLVAQALLPVRVLLVAQKSAQARVPVLPNQSRIVQSAQEKVECAFT